MTTTAGIAATPPTNHHRQAQVVRNTAETQITARVDLDGTGQARLDTGIGFFDHMLDQIARHGLIDLDIQARGDLHIDGHHAVLVAADDLDQLVARDRGPHLAADDVLETRLRAALVAQLMK